MRKIKSLNSVNQINAALPQQQLLQISRHKPQALKRVNDL
jgi:hypothetical protein